MLDVAPLASAHGTSVGRETLAGPAFVGRRRRAVQTTILVSLDKKALTEVDIRSKFITPAIAGDAGSMWNVMTQSLEETYFTKRRVIVRGTATTRRKAKYSKVNDGGRCSAHGLPALACPSTDSVARASQLPIALCCASRAPASVYGCD